MSYAEEKVFTIPELRLIILSYYLKHPEEKEKITCYQKFKEKIDLKKEILNDKLNSIIYKIILKIHMRNYI